MSLPELPPLLKRTPINLATSCRSDKLSEPFYRRLSVIPSISRLSLMIRVLASFLGWLTPPLAPVVCLGAPQVLGTDHLNPRLACHTNTPTFRINLAQKRQGKINIHPLFGHKRLGKVGRNIFPTLGTLGDGFDLFHLFRLTWFRIHRLGSPGWWHAMRSRPTDILRSHPGGTRR